MKIITALSAITLTCTLAGCAIPPSNDQVTGPQVMAMPLQELNYCAMARGEPLRNLTDQAGLCSTYLQEQIKAGNIDKDAELTAMQLASAELQNDQATAQSQATASAAEDVNNGANLRTIGALSVYCNSRVLGC